MNFHFLAILLAILLVLPCEVAPSIIQNVENPWRWHRPYITPPRIHSTIIPTASFPSHISSPVPSSISIGSITSPISHIPIPSTIPPNLVEIHRVKRGFWKKLGKSIEKGFHKVRNAALPAAGAAIGASILG